MNNDYLDRLIHSKPSIAKKIYGGIVLLLVAAILMTTASFAWFTLSINPQTSEVTTVITSNGNLEIALATTQHLSVLKQNDMYDPSNEFVLATGDPIHDNVLWGNQLDINSSDYGLHTLRMRPALLNVIDGSIAAIPISIGSYGPDGRLEELRFDAENLNLDAIGLTGTYDTMQARPIFGSVTMSQSEAESGNFNKKELLDTLLNNVNYGVRLAGPLEYIPKLNQSAGTVTIDFSVDSYCFAIDMLFRTNADAASLLLQTEGVQRVESEYPELHQGQGSYLEPENPSVLAAINVIFADTLTGKVYALAQADQNGKLWITARMDKNGSWIKTDDDDSAYITSLTQNQVSAITAWVFLNGELISNSDASVSQHADLKMNLQFSTDAVLFPAYSDTPTAPETPSRPKPNIYYISQTDDEKEYTLYTLNNDGVRDYELSITGTVNAEEKTFTIDSARAKSSNRIIIPGKVISTSQTYPVEETAYQVLLNPNHTFPHVSNTEVYFQEIDNQKVILNGTSTSSLFSQHMGHKYFTVLDMSGLDTSRVTDMSETFLDCSSVTTLILTGLDTSNVTDMSRMFERCNSVQTLDVSSFDTSMVTNMSCMFAIKDFNYFHNSLKHLDLSNFDTSQVTDMSGMFQGADDLIALDLSSFDTSKVTDMSEMFQSCYALTDLNISNFDTSNVTNMYRMFYTCSNISTLDVSDFDTSKVTNMAGMFHYCPNLTELDIGGFDTAQVTNMSSMFYECSKLSSLDVSKFDTSNVVYMNNMFENCKGITTLDVGNWNTSNVKNMSFMFIRCSSLATLDVSNFDTAQVTTMESMFEDCSKLTALDVSNWKTSKVTTMGKMFFGCSSLTTLDYSGWEMSQANTYSMFGGCPAGNQ